MKKLLLLIVAIFALFIIGFNIWGAATLGTINVATNPERNSDANSVVLVMGATGSAGDGLLKAAIEDKQVKKVLVLTRRTTPRIDAGVASGKVELHLHQDFTDYSSLKAELAEVNTVLWGLGTSSLSVDDETYTLIHVDFTIAFIKEWLAARNDAPMALHYITGMGTDPEGDARWAREKGRLEREMAELAAPTPLRTFSYRSAWIRPTSENSNALIYVGEQLLKPGKLVITSKALGQAMLEISARTNELANGTLIDNADSIAYAQAYQKSIAQ
ncbi:MAG: hypothetical protein AB8B48_16085 [Pseudomonadales bacterium]